MWHHTRSWEGCRRRRSGAGDSGLRIGFLTKEYAIDDFFLGGLGNYLRRLTLALVEEGHQPHVFFYSDHPAEIQVDNGIFVHRINDQPSGLLSLATAATRRRLRHTLASLEGSFRMWRYVRKVEERYPLDIVQSTNYGLLALLIASSLPTVIRCSSYRPLWDKYDKIRLSVDRRVYTWLEGAQYRGAAGVFAPSQLLSGILERELGVPDVAVIRTPFFKEVRELDDGTYRKRLEGEDYVLFFGRLSPQKGAQVLARAMPRVWKHFPEVNVVFVGQGGKYDGNMTMEAYIRAQSAGHEDKLVLLPPLEHEALYPIVANARLIVLPSFIDNAPNTMLEAMGFSKPVVGTYGSSMDEFIEDGVSGFLIERGNHRQLAETMCRALNDPALAQIGEAARRVVEESLRPEDILPQLLGFYQECLASAR